MSHVSRRYLDGRNQVRAREPGCKGPWMFHVEHSIPGGPFISTFFNWVSLSFLQNPRIICRGSDRFSLVTFHYGLWGAVVRDSRETKSSNFSATATVCNAWWDVCHICGCLPTLSSHVAMGVSRGTSSFTWYEDRLHVYQAQLTHNVSSHYLTLVDVAATGGRQDT